jgi:hypothetical protein
VHPDPTGRRIGTDGRTEMPINAHQCRHNDSYHKLKGFDEKIGKRMIDLG